MKPISIRILKYVLLALPMLACFSGGFKEGDPCSTSSEGDFACTDEANAVVCEDEKFKAIPCRGEQGCLEDNGKVLCDQSGNLDGDGCSKANDGRVLCSTDGKSLLKCSSGSFTIQACPNSCITTSGKAGCI